MQTLLGLAPSCQTRAPSWGLYAPSMGRLGNITESAAVFVLVAGSLNGMNDVTACNGVNGFHVAKDGELS